MSDEQADTQADTQPVPTVRAKFRVAEVTFRTDPAGAPGPRQYKLTAVYDTSTEENRRFTKATPWGELVMTVDNPDVQFVPGQYFYADFTPAEQ